MIEKYIIDMLTENTVSVVKQKVTEIEGQELKVGEPHRKAYVNSVQGRLEVRQELPAPQVDAILAVWGETASPMYEELQN